MSTNIQNQPQPLAGQPASITTALENFLPSFLKKNKQAPSGLQKSENKQSSEQPPAQKSETGESGGNPNDLKAESPMDKFKEIWNNPESKDSKKATKLFSPDMESFGKVVEGMDFAKTVSPEDMKKILEGDAEALKTVINSSSRAAFSQALLASSSLMEDAFARKVEESEARMEKKFKTLSTSEKVAASNPAFANPAIKPLVKLIENTLAEKFPEASSSEITAKAQEYFSSLAKLVIEPASQSKGKSDSPGQSSKFSDDAGEFDWLKFANQ